MVENENKITNVRRERILVRGLKPRWKLCFRDRVIFSQSEENESS